MRIGLLLLAGLVMGGAALRAESPVPVPRDTLPANLSLEEVPLGLAPLPAAKHNPPTAAKIRLGRLLFFDPILSADNTLACASCHQPDHGFTSGEARPRGIGGRKGIRRAPTLFNRVYGNAFFWDGREATLEAQALRPIEDPDEMGSRLADVLARLRRHKDYPRHFAAISPDGVTADNLAHALASFERVLLRGDSRVDRFRRLGETTALTARERHGLWLYESKAQCWRCHGGPNFTDERFHNTGVGWGEEPADLGRRRVTGRDEDRGKFKTPTLRGVRLTAPYMHNGSLATLEAVVEFYNRGGKANPYRDESLRPLELSKEESEALVAFLKAL